MDFFGAMFSYMTRLMNPKQICYHCKIDPIHLNHNFCPDCGKKIALHWFFIKCSCCNSKRPGYHFFDKYIPVDKYCKKCGELDFVIENKEKIELFEYCFASCKIVEIDRDYLYNIRGKTRVWIEEEETTSVDNINQGKKQYTLIPITLPG